MRKHLLFLICTVAACAVFILWPDLDLTISAMFYDGAEFPLKHSAYVQLVDRFGMWPMRFTAIGAFIAWLFSFNEASPDWAVQWRNGLLFMALVGLIGNGLVIQTTLKDHWGRARPAKVAEFGGKHDFTPFYAPADECRKNCSFPSGHTAAGFYFLAFALVLTGKARKEAYLGGTLLGVLFGFARIAQGKHYLSDVIFAGLIMWTVIVILDTVFTRYRLKPFRT